MTSSGKSPLLIAWSGAAGWRCLVHASPSLTLQSYSAEMIQPLSSIRETHLFSQQRSISMEVMCARTCPRYPEGGSELDRYSPRSLGTHSAIGDQMLTSCYQTSV